ncbi:major facilitator superfamily domain-containing protein [Plectosphaerella plurivora]|uniref:Major facilitator superfamily domain-containing protein n=1 Tax=Plectosphaerella plurivora TaxID=936078 RepID=A0A9P8V4Z6_9PEZI|nr:major facilitator superfamily domain-containing protein [Plectosphaerella plurivora]
METSTSTTAPAPKNTDQENLQYAPITMGGRASMASSTTQHHDHEHVPSTKEHRDPNLDLSLPYRTLTADANMAEYTTENPQGEIPAARKPDSPSSSEDQYMLVTFVPNDPENPRNWSTAYRWYVTLVVAVTCFVVAFCSSVITADVQGVASEFNVSEEVALLSISVFVVGFGIGPMAFAPLSEIYGRRVIYGSTLLIAVIFIIPCAVAKNITTLLVCRTIDGIAFSAPMTLVGGTLADLWHNGERGVPMAAFSAAPFIGPAIGPLVGGFLSDNLGWRWLYYIQLILAFVVWVLITFTVPETYAPTILARRAASLRKSTGSSSHVTEQDIDPRPMSARLVVFLIRPFQLLFGELIVFLISLYMSVLYGLLYMFFVAYPIVYQGGKGWSASNTGLMFIPIAVGVLLSAACAPLVNKHYLKVAARYDGHPPPEIRLIPMMISCWCIPIGLFIFAWTSYPRLHWIGPALGGFPVGFGFIFLYNSANNYLVDSYQHQAASALAAKTCIRSFWGAAVVLFTEQMYDRLGDQWASTLLAFLGLACCVIPFLFWKFGAKIRERSKYAYSGDDETSTSDEEKGKKGVEGITSGPLRSEDQDNDLRRARSYVSNP